MNRCLALAAMVLAVALTARQGWAQSGTKSASGSDSKKVGVHIGEMMPDFEMKDTEGKKHTLKQYRGKVVVLDFCSQNCPFSRGADPDIVALAKKYADEDVVVLGIDSDRGNTPEDIREYANKTGIKHPILKDEANRYADRVDAQKTPEIYVVDREGKLAYHGAFDNRRGPTSEASEHYTEDAVKAVLDGKKVAKPEVAAWGCGIKRAG